MFMFIHEHSLVLRLSTFLQIAVWLQHLQSSQDSLRATCQCRVSRAFVYTLPLKKCSVGYHTTLDGYGQQHPIRINEIGNFKYLVQQDGNTFPKSNDSKMIQ